MTISAGLCHHWYDSCNMKNASIENNKACKCSEQQHGTHLVKPNRSNKECREQSVPLLLLIEIVNASSYERCTKRLKSSIIWLLPSCSEKYRIETANRGNFITLWIYCWKKQTVKSVDAIFIALAGKSERYWFIYYYIIVLCSLKISLL